MTALHLLTIGIAASLAYSTSLAGPAVLGVVVAANRVHINTAAVTTGATVYDGDNFSTEKGGRLLLRGDATMIQLSAESTVIVHGKANGVQGIQAELSVGTLVFNTKRAAALEVIADEACIRPTGEGPSFGQVTVIGPKELLLYARRGPLQFSYRGETEEIAEGKSYRVILDPPDGGTKEKEPVPPSRWRKAFLLIAIGGEAGVIAWEIHEWIESPDRP